MLHVENTVAESDLQLELLHAATCYTMKPLNSKHLRVLKNLSVFERCPLLGGNLIKIIKFGS